jgi:RNA polymerase primary sigma factor
VPPQVLQASLPQDLEALAVALKKADPDGSLLHAVVPCLPRGPGRDRVLAAKRSCVRARNRFMCANLRLVVMVAKRLGRRYLPLADRVQEGNLGLLKAIDRFDPELGFRFSTYAAWWIRHAVTRALVKYGRTVRIPSYIHALFNRVSRNATALRSTLGRTPTLAELAESVDAPVEKVAMALDAMALRAVGLDEPANGDGGPSIGDVLPDEALDGWQDRIGERIDGRLAGQLLDDLDDMSFDILVHRFGLRGAPQRTLRALGDDYALSRERIRQLQNRTLRGLRDALDASETPSVAV